MLSASKKPVYLKKREGTTKKKKIYALVKKALDEELQIKCTLFQPTESLLSCGVTSNQEINNKNRLIVTDWRSQNNVLNSRKWAG